jgi:acetate kinase
VINPVNCATAARIHPANRGPRNGSNTRSHRVLILNYGSSSLKFSVCEMGEDAATVLLKGKLERLGTGQSHIEAVDRSGSKLAGHLVSVADHKAALTLLLERLPSFGAGSIDAVGHGIFLSGARHPGPELVTPAFIDKLRAIRAPNPSHFPAVLDALQIALRLGDNVPQVACFDMTFQRSLLAIARLSFSDGPQSVHIS